MADLKVGGLRPYQNYEVEAVPAYPDINPQQADKKLSVETYPDSGHRDDQTRRRFRAMRRLIDELKKTTQITRVDYRTTEGELSDIGRAVAEQDLIQLLLNYKIPMAELEALFTAMRRQLERPLLRTSAALTAERNFLPVYVPGLLEGTLAFQKIPLAPLQNSPQVMKSLDQDRFYSNFYKRIGVEIFALKEFPDTWFLNLSLLVAVGEVDEEGRRVLLYQRPDQTYALYADKHIDLSI